MACYYCIVISSTHLRDGQLRSIKGVFRGPLGAGGHRSTEEADSSLYCELCDKQYDRQQQFDNHTSSYDHHHRQRLKELKQREYYRVLASRRQRRRRDEPRGHQLERGPRNSAPGSGPMFRSTTVALDTVDTVKPSGADIQTELRTPPTTRVQRGPHWLSILGHNLSTDPNMPPSHLSSISHTALPRNTRSSADSEITTTNRASDTPLSVSRPHMALSDSRLRPVCFSLPKRSCVLLHQSAAVFLQASPSTEENTGSDRPKAADSEQLKEDRWDSSGGMVDNTVQFSLYNDSIDQTHPELNPRENPNPAPELSLAENPDLDPELNPKGNPDQDPELNPGENPDLDPELPHNTVTSTPDNADHMKLNSSEKHKDLPGLTSVCSDANTAFSDCVRPKEPFCRVLSRDGGTVLLWPSEMVSYTSTTPSISFSVNPLLYDFRAQSRAQSRARDQSAEPQRRKPSVIKQSGRQQRQGGDKGAGALSTHEREQGEWGGSPVEVVAHCNRESDCPDQNVLNCPLDSELGGHLFSKKGRRKRRGMRKRGKRQRGHKKDRDLQIGVNPQEAWGGNRGVGYEPEHRAEGHNGQIRGDQTGSHDEKRAQLLSNLPVSRCNRCNQLCAQVNSQAGRQQSQQSVSEWGRRFRKLHGGGAACNAVISLVPGSDMETPRCPAITPGPAQSSTDMWEAPVENGPWQNESVQENSRKAGIKEDQRESHVEISLSSLARVEAAQDCEMIGNRECNEVIRLQSGSSRHHIQDCTLHCCTQRSQTQENIRPTGADLILCAATVSKQITPAPTSCKRRSNSSETGPPRKKHQKGVTHSEKSLTSKTSDLSVLEEELTCSEHSLLTTAIIATKTNCNSHFEKTHISKLYKSDSDDRHSGTKEQNSSTACVTCRDSESKNTGEDCGAASDSPLVKKDTCNELCNNQDRQDQQSGDMRKLRSNKEPTPLTGDCTDLSRCNDGPNIYTALPTAPFRGHSSKNIDPNIIDKKNKVEKTPYDQTTSSETVIDSKSRVLDVRLNRDQTSGGHSNHVTNCNYPQTNTNGGVVLLISTHPGQTRKDLQKERQKKVRDRLRRRGEEGRTEWASPCLQLPFPLCSSRFSFHHTILQQHLSLLPPPLAVAPVVSPFSPHLSPLRPPLLPAFYPSAPLPLLEGHYPLPAAFHPLPSAPASLFAPPHPAVIPLPIMF